MEAPSPAFLTDKELNKTSTLNSPIFILRNMSAFSLNVANVKYKSFLILDTGDIGFFLFFYHSHACLDIDIDFNLRMSAGFTNVFFLMVDDRLIPTVF